MFASDVNCLELIIKNEEMYPARFLLIVSNTYNSLKIN
jgi:hypothetical protein